MKHLLIVALIVMSGALTAEINVVPIHSILDLPDERPQQGQYRLHLIDVGSGLSILVQGHDWNLLYDGGSADDYAGNPETGDSNSRLVAYLYKAIGSSGDINCRPSGDDWPTPTSFKQRSIQYLFLSHPHEDHGNLLDDVLECYSVSNIWDSGASNDTEFYRRIIERISEEGTLAYRTARNPSADKKIMLPGTTIQLPAAVSWQQFAEGQVTQLDSAASLKILHADAGRYSDPNQNSIVVRLRLGSKVVLLVGDAESGTREKPHEALGDIEKHLVENYPNGIDADILQVGNHGSLTSSRTGFIETVSPDIALISAGPKKFKAYKLPDPEIVESLSFQGIRVLQTDYYDSDCPVADRVGRDDDQPGGCSNFMLEW